MEVTGKRANRKKFARSTKGSGKLFEKYCEACNNEGVKTEAHGYCKNCEEFLCASCITSHRKVRMTKNHIILDKDKMPKVQKRRKHDTNCTEKCPKHPKEIILYYCKGHEKIGCHECMSADHSSCVNDYIPEISNGIKDSSEYKDMLDDINILETKARRLEEKAKRGKDISEHCYSTAVKDIETFKQDIIKQLDQHVEDLLKEALSKKETINKAMDEVLNDCTTMTNVASKFKEETKTPDATSDSNMFVLMKMNKHHLEKYKMTLRSEATAMKKSAFEFKPKMDLKNLLKTRKALGELIYSDEFQAEIEDKAEQTACATQGTKFNVKCNLDKEDCDIVDMGMLSSEELVLADFNNMSVKVFSLTYQKVTDELKVSSQPQSVAVLDKYKIAAVQYYKLLIISKSPKLKLQNKIALKDRCNQVRCSKDKLIVLCCYPTPAIHVLNFEGKILRTLLSDSDKSIFKDPQHLALSADGQFMYISDYQSDNKITQLDMNGKVFNVYKNEDKTDVINQPRGIASIKDGSVYVCDFFGNRVLKFTANLKTYKSVFTESDGLQKPKSVYFCSENNKLYIAACDDSNDILCFDAN